MTNHHQCCKCANKATWFYTPYNDGRDKYYCDDHIHRGCSCMWITKEEYEHTSYERENWKLVKLSDTHYEYRDLMDRQLPCCEYDYCEEGFEIE